MPYKIFNKIAETVHWANSLRFRYEMQHKRIIFRKKFFYIEIAAFLKEKLPEIMNKKYPTPSD